ncbi:MAG: class I SAM-dependent methyltransferase [Brevefilum sp.]
MNKIRRWIQFNLRYFARPPWDTGVSPPELIDYLQSTQPGQALDLGCGTGTNLVTLAAHGWRVVGIDLALISVWKARAKLKRAGLAGRVIRGNVAGQVDVGATFDLVVDIGCYHSLGRLERERYRQNLLNWLNPGGVYLLYAHRKTLPGEAYGVSEIDFKHFSTLLNCQWQADSDERRPDGGGGRPATWVRFEYAAEQSTYDKIEA